MSTILIFVENKENRRLLVEWVEKYHEAVVATDAAALNTPFDCAVVDGVSLSRCSREIQAQRDLNAPFFLPFLLITSRQDVKLASRHLWRRVDEMIFSPIEKIELQARIEILLRARHLSLDMGSLNKQLSQAVAAESLARQKAEAADQAKLRFLAMVSHELRTPLTSIKGFSSSLLADDVVLEADTRQEFIEIIDEEADKMNLLVSQLLDLSRLQAGTFVISPGRHRVDQIVNLAQAQIGVLAASHRVDLDIAPDLPAVSVDLTCAAQILTNLIGNAAKYSPERTRIGITVQRAGPFIQVEIADEGFGVAAEDRDVVFEAFRQLDRKEHGHRSGAGLGLAICKGLVEAHGGKIWIEDRSSPGTTVAFTLPIA